MTATTNIQNSPLPAPGWHSEELGEIATALAIVQGEMENVVKKQTGEIKKDGKLLYTFKFADLAAVIDSSRPLLAANGLSVIQRPMQSSVGVRLHTVILHKSGQWIGDGAPELPVAKKDDPKAYGSGQSYLRRYGHGAMVGIAGEDDDAAKAAEKPKPAAKKASTKLADVEKRDALYERITNLPDELKAQVAEKLKAAKVVWTQLSDKEYKLAEEWTVECEGIAEAASE